MARLTRENWKAVRDRWEYDPDQPSFTVAAARAAETFNFAPPDKSSVCRRAGIDRKHGNEWRRYGGSLPCINQAAHRKADSISLAADPPEVVAQKTQAAREESENLRAEVISRHRLEWKIAIAMRNEALQDRKVDIKTALEKARLAKIAAEVLQIQQNGERKAWGLDEINIDVSMLSDAQLQDVINGKLPR